MTYRTFHCLIAFINIFLLKTFYQHLHTTTNATLCSIVQCCQATLKKMRDGRGTCVWGFSYVNQWIPWSSSQLHIFQLFVGTFIQYFLLYIAIHILHSKFHCQEGCTGGLAILLHLRKKMHADGVNRLTELTHHAHLAWDRYVPQGGWWKEQVPSCPQCMGAPKWGWAWGAITNPPVMTQEEYVLSQAKHNPRNSSHDILKWHNISVNIWHALILCHMHSYHAVSMVYGFRLRWYNNAESPANCSD